MTTQLGAADLYDVIINQVDFVIYKIHSTQPYTSIIALMQRACDLAKVHVLWMN